MYEELSVLGLSEKEISVYITCLKLGSSTAFRISELCNLPRTTVYEILERLKVLGLITKTIIEHKTNFNACEPQKLLNLLEEKKSSIKKIIPNLNEIQGVVGVRPLSEVYEGEKAVFSLFDEILEYPNTTLKIIGSMENAIEKIGFRTDRFRNIRKDKKIKVMQILEKSKDSVIEKNDSLTEVRLTNSIKESKEVIFILEELVYHIILHNQIYAIRIHSKEHAKAMELLFDSMWNSARKK